MSEIRAGTDFNLVADMFMVIILKIVIMFVLMRSKIHMLVGFVVGFEISYAMFPNMYVRAMPCKRQDIHPIK